MNASSPDAPMTHVVVAGGTKDVLDEFPLKSTVIFSLETGEWDSGEDLPFEVRNWSVQRPNRF